MKNFILLFIFTLISIKSYSQITITNNVNPVPGDAQKIIDCDTTGVSQGNAGANQTWNFTGLNRTDSSIITFVSSASTPYSSQFPTSNVASTIDNSNFQYFTTSPSNLLVNGNAGPSFVVVNSDPQTFLQYPFSYTNSFSDNFSANYNLSGFDVRRTGTQTVSADAYGTINLPFGSFSNALRLKYVISTKDSSNPGFPVVIITNITSYVWFVGGKKFPVCEIIYSSSVINGLPQTNSKLVSYSPNNPSIGITQTGTEVPEKYTLGQNYPNPFNPVTKINYELRTSDNVSLKVYDALGKQVAVLVNEKQSAGSYQVDWNADNFYSGTYYYKFESGDFSETRKMILLK